MLRPSPLSTLSFAFRHRALPFELLSSSLQLLRLNSSVASAPPAQFTYTHATSFYPKPQSATASTFKGFPASHPIALWVDERLRGEKAQEWGAGQDFWLVKDLQMEDKGLVVGVADGVGGWEESGVDPSLFSQALSFYAEKAIETRWKEEGVTEGKNESPRLRQIMWDAFNAVKGDEAIPAGSSTAQLLHFSSSGHMSGLNLGDSTFFILRRNKLIHMQPAQTHFFNAPRQLAKLPKNRPNQPGSLVDSPAEAAGFACPLEDGDLIFACTDGFSDNVWPNELEQLWEMVQNISKEKDGVSIDGEQDMLDKFVTACVNYARMCSHKIDKESPFEAEAKALHIDGCQGGKVDDCTVIAIWAKKL